MVLSIKSIKGLSVDYKHLQFQQIQISFFLELPAAGRHTRGWHGRNGVAPLQVLHLPVKEYTLNLTNGHESEGFQKLTTY
jgi:hypothetical protein